MTSPVEKLPIHRIKVFIDFWNFQLSLREKVDSKSTTDWEKLHATKTHKSYFSKRLYFACRFLPFPSIFPKIPSFLSVLPAQIPEIV